MFNEITKIISRSWRTHFWTSVATTGVLTLSFSLILGTLLFSTNLARLLTVWGDEIQITLYLKDDISTQQRQTLDAAIRQESSVSDVKFIDKIQAAQSFEKSLSQLGPGFLSALRTEKENPFPASLQISLAKKVKTPERVAAIAQRLQQMPGVEDSSYGQEWIKNYNVLMRVIRVVTVILICVILIGCLFTVGNAIRATLAARKEEIEILELVGATAKNIRRPFIVEGGFQGLLASAVALTVLALVYGFLHQTLEGVMSTALLASTMKFFGFFQIFFYLIAGLGIGALGSYLCVMRVNTGWSAAERQ